MSFAAIRSVKSITLMPGDSILLYDESRAFQYLVIAVVNCHIDDYESFIRLHLLGKQYKTIDTANYAIFKRIEDAII